MRTRRGQLSLPQAGRKAAWYAPSVARHRCNQVLAGEDHAHNLRPVSANV
ncbi:MAG: hypothetical protein ACKV2Q_13860 [Planctomycetaceae bacterium]